MILVAPDPEAAARALDLGQWARGAGYVSVHVKSLEENLARSVVAITGGAVGALPA
jgi:hypothetical protein